MSVKLDFDDVLIVPQFSDITSRSQVDVSTTISGRWGASITGVPVIAANMDGVGTFSMHHALKKFGAFTEPEGGKGFVWTSGKPYSSEAYENLHRVTTEVLSKIGV